MVTEEYMIRHYDGFSNNIVCTTTSLTWAKRFMKILTKYIVWNYKTTSIPQTKWDEVKFNNSHRIDIQQVKRITDIKSFKALL